MKRSAPVLLLVAAVVILIPFFGLTGCQLSCSVGGTTPTTAAGTSTTAASTTTTTAVPTTLTTVAANTTAPAPSSTTQGQTTTTTQKPSTTTTSKIPTITALSPNSGPLGGMITVIITGTNFTGAKAVMFGGHQAMWTVNSATKITATPPPGAGTVQVVVTTAAGSSSTVGTANDFTYIETLQTVVSITGVLAWKTYEDTDPHLVWAAGHWNTGEGSSYSGGTIHLTDAVGATVTVTFTGTRIALIASKAPDQGIAGAWVDGNTASLAPVDFYSPSVTDQQVVWQSPVLPYGTHQAQLWWEGEKNSSSSGTSINVDAFKILGTIQ